MAYNRPFLFISIHWFFFPKKEPKFPTTFLFSFTGNYRYPFTNNFSIYNHPVCKHFFIFSYKLVSACNFQDLSDFFLCNCLLNWMHHRQPYFHQLSSFKWMALYNFTIQLFDIHFFGNTLSRHSSSILLYIQSTKKKQAYRNFQLELVFDPCSSFCAVPYYGVLP
mgnify:CR=1 FL=1